MKLFKRQKKIEEVDNYEYWKDPRLDDEGTYDYLAEELPRDTARWQWYYQKCDICGKCHRLNFKSTHYFYCWDGWDYMSDVECWKCGFKSRAYGVKSKIKNKIFKGIEHHNEYRKLIKSLKEKNIPITKELKEMVKELCQ